MSYKGSFFIIFFLFLFSFVFFPLSTFANIPDQSHSSLSVSSSVPADGQTTAIITVTLQDSSGNPVAGHLVRLSDSSNSGVNITTILDTTDENGHALFSIRSTKIQTDNLDVTDTTSNIKFYNLGKITFTTAGCFDSPPGSAPQLVSATVYGSNQITLTWIGAANPVTRYLVSYGLASGQYIYGNPNVGGQGTTSYTVGLLSPGKRYYFVVQPINGCTPGNFSNEVSAIAGEIVIDTPTLTPTSSIDVAPKTNIQNIVTPSSILKVTSIPSQNVHPTAPSTLIQTSIIDSSKAKVLVVISICILVVGSIGNFLYWKHEKNVKETIKILEENQY